MSVNLGLDDELAGVNSLASNSASWAGNVNTLVRAAFLSTSNPFGDAALKTTGTASGNVPVLDSNGRLSASMIPAASSSSRGAVELATGTETRAGTRSDVAVTPGGLSSFVANSADAKSVTSGQLLTAARAYDHAKFVRMSGAPHVIIRCINSTGGGGGGDAETVWGTLSTEYIDNEAGFTVVTSGGKRMNLGAGKFYFEAVLVYEGSTTYISLQLRRWSTASASAASETVQGIMGRAGTHGAANGGATIEVSGAMTLGASEYFSLAVKRHTQGGGWNIASDASVPTAMIKIWSLN